MTPPAYFDDEHRRVLALLVAAVRAGSAPDSTLEAYVVEFCRWRAAETWLAENGPEIYIRDDKGVLKSVIVAPRLRIARDAMAAVERLSKALRLRGPLE